MKKKLKMKILQKKKKKYDLNNDGVLNEQEKSTLNEDKLLNSSGTSAWRKRKLQDYLDGKTKRYF